MSEAVTTGTEQHAYERDEVVKIINSVISKVEHAEDESKAVIFKELTELQKIIEETRSAMGSARPSDIKDKHIPTATDELDAVVESTAEATGTIMDACEAIQEKAAVAGGDVETAIMGETMKIFEACSFQDITGQRITKVVSTLKEIETKVGKLMEVMGGKIPASDEDTSAEAKGSDGVITDEDLLNGPQLPGNGVSQADIDKLLDEF